MRAYIGGDALKGDKKMNEASNLIYDNVIENCSEVAVKMEQIT